MKTADDKTTSTISHLSSDVINTIALSLTRTCTAQTVTSTVLRSKNG